MLRPFLNRTPIARPAARRPVLQLEALEDRTMPAATGLAAVATEELSANERFVTRIASSLVDAPLAEPVRERLVAWLDQGRSREEVATWVLGTQSARRAEVETTFEHLLDRDPTARELKVLSTRSGREADQLALIWRVIRSDEYFRTQGGGTAAGFIDALADDLLGRPATEAEAASWLGNLQRGMSRTRFTNNLLTGTAYREAAAAQLARHGSPTVEDPELTAAVLAELRGPLALTRAKARVYGSDQYLDWLLNPPTRPASPSVGNPIVPPNPGYPFTPGFSLTTNWNPISAPGVGLFSLLSIGASPAGAYWIGTTDAGVVVTNPVAGANVTAWSGAALSIAPISDNEAWVVGSQQYQDGNLFVAKVTQGGTVSQVAALPGGDTPKQIAAAPDGTVWVLGQSGTVYSYAAGTNSWSTVASNGFTIKQISIGSATSIWAVGQSQGAAVTLSWTTGGGWAIDSFFNGTTPTQVAATVDGSVWAVVEGPGNGLMALRPPAGAWGLVPNQTIPDEVFYLAATDRNRALAAVDSGEELLQVLSVGVVDRPATAFPEVTDQWALGYQAINEGLGINLIEHPGGVRQLYDDATGNFQTWLDDLQNGRVAMPLGISAENWGTITNQIQTELNNVIGVNSLFTQLGNLNTAISTVNSDRLAAANTNVGLSTQQQQNDTAELFIEGMFEAALAGIAAALSDGASVAASIIASGVDNLIADLTGQPNPTPSTKLAATYAALETLLGNLFLDNAKNYGNAQTKIVNDYGMLSAVGGAVNSGLWDWEDATGSTLAQAATDAFDLFFYQTLTPINWQIVYLNDYICDLYTCPTIYSPNYATYVVVITDAPNDVLEDVWYVSKIGATTNPFSKDGVYPLQAMMTAIFGLQVSQADFYTGQAGWTLKQVNAT